MTSIERLIALMIASNPQAALLSPSVITLSPPRQLIGNKVEVTICAVPDTGYLGSVDINYNRINLSEFGTGLSFIEQYNYSLLKIVDNLNTLRNSYLAINDIDVTTVIDAIDPDIKIVTITAKPTSYEWFGSVVITVLTHDLGETTNEAVLASVLRLRTDLAPLLQRTFVNNIDGFSGEVTKTQLQINLVDNTPDIDKPVSILQRQAIDDSLKSGTGFLTKLNNTTDDLRFGTVIYANTLTGIAKANPTDETKSNAIGLVFDDIMLSNNGSGKIQTTGVISGTLEQWDRALDISGGLIPNKRYYLSEVPGKLTGFMPLTANYLTMIGIAISQTEFSINIEPTIKL